MAWDFLLYAVQEDAAVRVKIAHWPAFNGSHGERRLGEVLPFEGRPWNTDQPALSRAEKMLPSPVAFGT